ncbi:hypothetical protein T5p086 [Escherichia phage T5]|uniref:ORF083 n=4 Tax=root TaxID=1 RepID=Q5DML1_BPT5|nr:hypothetical protein T5.088 [Escherichia phage T5]AAS77134.1 hypothetical protein T5.088 [Escherichia phage T5]AAU05225.1 hypothetical protein T5p086 [Escherichia phage T5]AAX12020.1 ORF083 [Escherichia phage T5]
MRNFVAKNDFNRASTHKSARDYTRLSSHEVMNTCYEELEGSWNEWPDFSMEENWDVSEDMLPGSKDLKKWESIKETAL